MARDGANPECRVLAILKRHARCEGTAPQGGRPAWRRSYQVPQTCCDEALGATRQGRPLSIADGGVVPDTFSTGYRRAELAILAAWRAVALLAAPSVRRCRGSLPIRSNAEQSPPNKLRGKGFPAELHITAESKSERLTEATTWTEAPARKASCGGRLAAFTRKAASDEGRPLAGRRTKASRLHLDSGRPACKRSGGATPGVLLVAFTRRPPYPSRRPRFPMPDPGTDHRDRVQGSSPPEAVGPAIAEAVTASPELRSTMKATSERAWGVYWTRTSEGCLEAASCLNPLALGSDREGCTCGTKSISRILEHRNSPKHSVAKGSHDLLIPDRGLPMFRGLPDGRSWASEPLRGSER